VCRHRMADGFRSGPEQLAMGTHSLQLAGLLQFLACLAGEPHIYRMKMMEGLGQVVVEVVKVELEEERSNRKTPPQAQSRR